MLGKRNAIANLAVSDIDRARNFYTGPLGLEEISQEGDDYFTLKSGDSNISVYRSDFAGTNKATAVSWEVDDIAREVDELKAKCIMFEHYDMEGLTERGDLYEADGYKLAWFKDPDGNILNLIGD
jgi:catechol 2,3-dioxygenase-like lactoylglutathione lyase family enzyme